MDVDTEQIKDELFKRFQRTIRDFVERHNQRVEENRADLAQLRSAYPEHVDKVIYVDGPFFRYITVDVDSTEEKPAAETSTSPTGKTLGFNELRDRVVEIVGGFPRDHRFTIDKVRQSLLSRRLKFNNCDLSIILFRLRGIRKVDVSGRKNIYTVVGKVIARAKK